MQNENPPKPDSKPFFDEKDQNSILFWRWRVDEDLAIQENKDRAKLQSDIKSLH